MLILDEATASVDNETEAAIQRSLERITRHRTTIVVAHRLSTVRTPTASWCWNKASLSSKAITKACCNKTASMHGYGKCNRLATWRLSSPRTRH